MFISALPLFIFPLWMFQHGHVGVAAFDALCWLLRLLLSIICLYSHLEKGGRFHYCIIISCRGYRRPEPTLVLLPPHTLPCKLPIHSIMLMFTWLLLKVPSTQWGAAPCQHYSHFFFSWLCNVNTTKSLTTEADNQQRSLPHTTSFSHVAAKSFSEHQLSWIFASLELKEQGGQTNTNEILHSTFPSFFL